MMYADAAISEEMQLDPQVVFYGRNMGMTERDPMLKKFGKNRVRLAPISGARSVSQSVRPLLVCGPLSNCG
jgi:pyruvate/2-oxoglutarate/acetoin dehydrogenase E1 component